MQQIDQFSDVPLYRQLARILQREIEADRIPRLSALPSEKQLEQEYGVSRDTVRRAMELLRSQGLAFTIPQRGTFAGSRPPRDPAGGDFLDGEADLLDS